MYTSVNETDKFGYNDCVLNRAELGNGFLSLSLEALIVKGDNSQNSNYTDSYAGESVMTFEGVKVVSLIRQGMKYFDADDHLINEVPDEELNVILTDIPSLLSKKFLLEVSRKEGKLYSLQVETPIEEYGDISDIYELTVESDKVTVTWEKYMNRVQN